MSKNVKIFYLLSEEGRKNSILLGGDGREEQKLEAEVNDRILRLAGVDKNGDITLNIGFSNSYSRDVFMGYEKSENEDEFGVKFTELTRIKYFNKLMTIDELIEWEEKRRKRIEKDKEEYGELISERQRRIDEKWETEREERYRQEKEGIEERRRKEEEQMREMKQRRMREENEEKAYCEEKEKWIQQFGSQYLKNALKLDYDVNKKYVEERAKKELPDYDVDYDNNTYWSEIENPSEKVLSEVIDLIENGFEAYVVWLTSPVCPIDDEYGDEFEETEAIAIRKYLGRYDLVKVC